MNRKHYHAGCLKVLRRLSQSRMATLEALAYAADLSPTGASARFRQLRQPPYNCELDCSKDDMGVWCYSILYAPPHLLKLAREMRQ